ncbi:MAG: response regulator [Planctomycetes bacterium]|nr:response regulator [Planctomycetota bacterium]
MTPLSPTPPSAAPWKVLLVDDYPENIGVLESFLADEPYEILKATNGGEAIDLIRTQGPDIVLLDVMMPIMDGFQVCRAAKLDPRTALMPIVLVTALDSMEDKIKGIDAGADDFLTKPVNPLELKARVASLLRIRKLVTQLDGAENVIRALARAVEAKDSYTEKHTERVSKYSVKLGRASGLAGQDLLNLELGAQIHDIGKIGVSDAVLNKPGKLEDLEFKIIMTHPMVGFEICRPLATLSRVVASVRHHHERYDGKGYPDGLVGEGIPLEARIVAIADAFDAMTSDRPYRKGMPVETAVDILSKGAGTQWDATLVTRFLDLIKAGEIP